ncbi:hypothetical protein L1987_17158 [Smallanthus sonchifolius]|uniref:Uncharacterized protein n=1 Tax=Smallanthus sonchifolius TaxID=185202 RepID=A0ACB9IX10_9ASTR|nr:hypothetical protein L1987_17158 [Smallanthus sonchifolius]
MLVAAPGGDTSSSEENTSKSSAATATAPVKKCAETWVKEETRTLIILCHEIDSLFNTSKSNKHLWERISLKMRAKGFDRSPTMCTDKWRNLLKEFKKAKENNNGVNHNGYSSNNKMEFYKEVEEIIRDTNKNSRLIRLCSSLIKGLSLTVCRERNGGSPLLQKVPRKQNGNGRIDYVRKMNEKLLDSNPAP